MDPLSCTVMPYAWGSRTAIASLTGRAPSDNPEAELWMGAHPSAPSFVVRGGVHASLADIIARAPHRELGEPVAHAFGPSLPFLLKVLAADEPLSLQAHPALEQARRGFDDEETRGVPIDAPHRNYKDPSHKPELLCALGPFEALSGFRRIDETLRLFDALAVPELEPTLAPLRASRDAHGLATTFRALMTMPAPRRASAIDATLTACRRPGDAFARERDLAARLAAIHPGDIGVVSALFLELVHLEAGDAIYLGAGNLHAYVHGTGVEIMASSDNVLRGGLTKKHVDVSELLRVLDFGSGPVEVLRACAIDAHESVYDTPAREFRLSRLLVDGSIQRTTRGPEILLVTEGHATANGVALAQGSSVFVPATTSSYILEGNATLFRATTNLPL